MKAQGIDETLIEIISFAFKFFSGTTSRPKWSNKTYLNLFCDTLNEMPEDAALDDVVHLLIRLGITIPALPLTVIAG